MVVEPGRVDSGARLASEVSLRGDQGSHGSRTVALRQDFRFSEQGRRAHVHQEIDGFGYGRLTLEDQKLAAEPEELLMAQRIGSEALQLAARGEELGAAAYSVAGELPVYALEENLVLVELRGREGGETTFAVLDASGGNRGPPNGHRFRVGAPDPGDRGDGPGGGARSIKVTVISEKDALLYVPLEKRRRVQESNEAVLRVQESLGRGDLAGAVAVLESPQAPPRAVAAVAVAAAEQKRFDLLDGLTLRLTREPPAGPDLRQVERALSHLHVDLARRGETEAERKVDLLEIELAVAARKLAPVDAEREAERSRTFVAYAPRGYAGRDLPPVSHPPGKALPADQRFVTEMIDLAKRQSALPARLRTGGTGPVELVPVTRQQPADAVPGSPHGAGSPWRLVSGAGPSPDGGDGDDEDEDDPVLWPLIQIVPCSIEEGTDLPSCYRETRPVLLWADPRSLQLSIEAACDANGDGRIETEEETECVRELERLAADRHRTAA